MTAVSEALESAAAGLGVLHAACAIDEDQGSILSRALSIFAEYGVDQPTFERRDDHVLVGGLLIPMVAAMPIGARTVQLAARELLQSDSGQLLALAAALTMIVDRLAARARMRDIPAALAGLSRRRPDGEPRWKR